MNLSSVCAHSPAGSSFTLAALWSLLALPQFNSVCIYKVKVYLALAFVFVHILEGKELIFDSDLGWILKPQQPNPQAKQAVEK